MMAGMWDELMAQPGFSPTQAAVGAVMYLAWTVAYGIIIYRGFKDRSYGVPWPCIVLNVAWEAIFSFEITHAKLHWFFLWGNRFWFVFDLLIIYQLARYGRDAQVVPWLKKWFYPLFALSAVTAFAAIYTFTLYFNDVKGVASSMSMNLVMSIAFPLFHLSRPGREGLSTAAAWLKMVGTLAGSFFLAVWWPAQFVDGHLRTHPHIAEPTTYWFMYFLYTMIFVFDCIYIALCVRDDRERKLSGAPAR
jgi:hypothetical protein